MTAAHPTTNSAHRSSSSSDSSYSLPPKRLQPSEVLLVSMLRVELEINDSEVRESLGNREHEVVDGSSTAMREEKREIGSIGRCKELVWSR
ncbi:MAG: hypothetical protein ABL921_33065 [Pirellula sp.]